MIRSIALSAIPGGLWSNARVPYVIDSPRDERLKRVLDQAIGDFHRYTCVRFVKRTDERNYLQITSTNLGCWSFLGNKRIGAQIVSLSGDLCKTKRHALHELMHAIGFWHEHQRTDRGYFVNIFRQNAIRDCYKRNFEIARFGEMSLIGKYDVDSIMHLPSDACANGHRETITLKHSNRRDFGLSSSYGLSAEDVRKINILYTCPSSNNSASQFVVTCPDYVTTHYQGDDGQRYPMCATVYDRVNCGNAWLKMHPNWSSSDLSTLALKTKRDWNWDNEIQSLEVNRGCQITLCQDKDFQGLCQTYEGGRHGRNAPTIGPLERDVTSMNCSCTQDQCPATVPRYYKDQNFNEAPTCGIIYEKQCCGGASFTFSIFKHPSLTDLPKSSGGTWYEQVRSAQVQKGCKLWLCSNATYRDCSNIEGKTDHNRVNAIDRVVRSIYCSCNSVADSGMWQRVQRGIRIESIIPAGDVNCNKRTCALAVQMFDRKAGGLWIPSDQRVVDRSFRTIAAFSYLVTAPGCTLRYCDGSFFNGNCDTIEPDKYRPRPHDYEVILLKSYNCTCVD